MKILRKFDGSTQSPGPGTSIAHGGPIQRRSQSVQIENFSKEVFP